ncbi:glycoside hydrolase family 2 protein [Salinicoccus sp. RF5]|uniref:glycoside hydrolase family 2 protein n=1 Tax=Salinicoccus sp. RF5 TaxID=2748874 RepID=UPI001E508DD2|nr:sugar-binding domain-containing protein [Salinicoccus sp. RF5]MCC4722332.1 glycoside hydrolase family 2 [Salinicoccus sp. RF5]
MRKMYPRPDFQREEWISLNGQWELRFDDTDQGIKEKWGKGFEGNHKITVPFAYQAELSNVDEKENHDILWYQKKFDITDKSKSYILNFGAVDYEAIIFVNGERIGSHIGGHSSFNFDITPYVEKGENLLVIRVYDPMTDETIPRGKQYWKLEPEYIFYTRTSGIWQSVWIDILSREHLDAFKFTPDIDRGTVNIKTYFDNVIHDKNRKVKLKISFEDQLISEDISTINSRFFSRDIDVRNLFTERSNIHNDGWYWTPENPNLFDVTIELLDETFKTLDRVETYFGMRKVEVLDGKFMLNNKAYYQKLVLDQGYFPKGLMTAPEDDDLKRDIELAKEMGFNGARKHQKVEDPIFLYWADKLGFLVWGEMANAAEYDEGYVERMNKEWIEVIERDYNHPSIVTWVPLNESWGISRVAHEKKQQDHSLSMYHLTKSLDNTRPVLSNEGWEHTQSDICGIHNYLDETDIRNHYQDVDSALSHTPANRLIYARGYEYNNVPIMITEYGGIAYVIDDKGWGYSSVDSEEALIEGYRELTEAIGESPVLHGYCYTQLTDVEQEINGLLTYDRKPKCDLQKIKEINDSVSHSN